MSSVSDYDGFAPIYDQFAAGMTEDVPFYVALAANLDGPVVELAVGTGRVAVPIAEQTGRRVIGIDVSSEMLGLARRRAADAGVELELRQGDMRELDARGADGSRHLPLPGDAPPPRPRRAGGPDEACAERPRPGRPVRLERVRVRSRDRAGDRRGLARGAGCEKPVDVRLRRAADRPRRSRTARPSSSGGSTATSGRRRSPRPASRSRRCTAGSTGHPSTRRAASSCTSTRRP